MEVLDNPRVWALGDCALVKQVDGNFSPPTAQHALRQAKTCAQNILALERGTKKQVFIFTGLGKLGSLGRRSAVAEVFGIRLKGIVAWVLWRGVYVTKFPGIDGQLRLLCDWMLDVFLPRDITQLRLFHDEAVDREHFDRGNVFFTWAILATRCTSSRKARPKSCATARRSSSCGRAICSVKRRWFPIVRAMRWCVRSRRWTWWWSAARRSKNCWATSPGLSANIEQTMSARIGRGVDLQKEVAEAMSSMNQT